jgi:CBS domain-containing protein
MKLSDLLMDDWVAVPLEAPDLRGALKALVDLLIGTDSIDADTADRLQRDLASASRTEVVRINEEIVLVVGRCEALEDASVLLGIGREPFKVPGQGRTTTTARAVILLLTPRRLELFRERLVPTLSRVLRDEDRTARLLSAGSAMEIRALRELMEIELHDRLLVEDALTPLKYRIYPDTPLLEVVDLMVRRRLRAVPVVGENYEVLGIVTVGDALKHLLPRPRAGEEAPRGGSGSGKVPRELGARDVMTRTVMCVSEDQNLLEAANIMVNRDVEELPVVREGELIGFLTREAILRMLFGSEGAAPAEG